MSSNFESLAFDRHVFGRFYRDHGNFYVTVRNEGEHHSTIRHEANAIVKRYNEENGTTFVVNAYLGPMHYRDGSGYPVTDKRFSVVAIG